MEEAEKGELLERNTKPGLDSHPGPTADLPLLTDDLILEILSCLPARSVHRFKSPQTFAGFLYFATDDSGHRHHFASFSGGAAPFDPSLPCLQPNKYKDMAQVDACNGLLLYRSSNNKLAHLNWNWVEDNFRFFVCNPLTGGDSGMVENVMLFYLTRCVFVGGIMYLMGIHKGINQENVLVGVDKEVKVWKIIRVQYSSRDGTFGSSQGCLHFAIASSIDKIEVWCLKDCDSNEFVLKNTTSIDKLTSMTMKWYSVAKIHPDCNTIFLVSWEGHILAT
ncbi:hypothetical protein VPH35_070227 [Triticum aestivum]